MDLPSSICRLKSLESLNVYRCLSIQTLPVDVGDIRSLKKLHAFDADIKQWPKGDFSRRRVCHVQSLSSTSVSCFSETDFPKFIGSLYSLEVLDLSGNNFHCLPFGFSKLQFLRFLRLNDCENLQTLPSVSNLENLKFLSLVNCKRLVKITKLDNLPCIEWINMLNCTSLQNPFNEYFFSAPALSLSPKGRTPGFEIYVQCDEIPDWCSN